jgi:hypothetical protein
MLRPTTGSFELDRRSRPGAAFCFVRFNIDGTSNAKEFLRRSPSIVVQHCRKRTVLVRSPPAAQTYPIDYY